VAVVYEVLESEAVLSVVLDTCDLEEARCRARTSLRRVRGDLSTLGPETPATEPAGAILDDMIPRTQPDPPGISFMLRSPELTPLPHESLISMPAL
jgi:hypothetical protein